MAATIAIAIVIAPFATAFIHAKPSLTASEPSLGS